MEDRGCPYVKSCSPTSCTYNQINQYCIVRTLHHTESVIIQLDLDQNCGQLCTTENPVLNVNVSPTDMHTYTQTQKQIHKHINIRAYTHTNTLTHIYSHKRINTHTHTHTHTHTQTHTYTHMLNNATSHLPCSKHPHPLHVYADMYAQNGNHNTPHVHQPHGPLPHGSGHSSPTKP